MSFSELLKTHQQKSQDWNKKLDESKQDIDESFKDLDDVQSDEIEKEIPVRTEAQNRRIEFEPTPRCPDSSTKENRFIPVTDYIQKPILKNINEKPHEMKKKSSKKNDREGMMKEVNDIIGELQSMLKPRVRKILLI